MRLRNNVSGTDEGNVDVRRSLEEIAATPHWMAFGRDLAQAVDTPANHGCSSPEEVLATVAKIRSVHPAALKDSISAARFLQAHRPDLLATKDERVRMTQVRLLEQLMAVDPELARKHEGSVYDGSIRYRELLTVLKEARRVSREQGAAADTARGRRQSRGRGFERAVNEYLEENIGNLLNQPNATVRSAQRLRPTPTDLVAVVDGEIVAAIEIKPFRLATYPRQIFETASLLAMLQRAFGEAWLVVAPEWEDNVPTLLDTMRHLDVDGVRIAVFDPKMRVGKQRFRVVEPSVPKQDQGSALRGIP